MDHDVVSFDRVGKNESLVMTSLAFMNDNEKILSSFYLQNFLPKIFKKNNGSPSLASTKVVNLHSTLPVHCKKKTQFLYTTKSVHERMWLWKKERQCSYVKAYNDQSIVLDKENLTRSTIGCRRLYVQCFPPLLSFLFIVDFQIGRTFYRGRYCSLKFHERRRRTSG